MKNACTVEGEKIWYQSRADFWEKKNKKFEKCKGKKIGPWKKKKKKYLAYIEHQYTVGAIIIWFLADFVGLPTNKEWNCV